MIGMTRIMHSSAMTPGVREIVKTGLSNLRQELGYKNSPTLEKLVVEQVLLSWLRLSIYEHQYTSLNKQGMTLTKAAFWEKRLSVAQRRFLRTCETLGRVRRLERNNPALQVNIATQDGKQVNIAGEVVK
jgi:hypothetical protein